MTTKMEQLYLTMATVLKPLQSSSSLSFLLFTLVAMQFALLCVYFKIYDLYV